MCAAVQDGGPADSFTNKLISLLAMAALALILIGIGLASVLQRLSRNLVLTAQALMRNPKVGFYLVRLDTKQNRRACTLAQSEPDHKS
jgi:hypothetical protein